MLSEVGFSAGQPPSIGGASAIGWSLRELGVSAGRVAADHEVAITAVREHLALLGPDAASGWAW